MIRHSIWLIGSVFALLLSGCNTLQEDRLVDIASSQELLVELDEIEELLTQLRKEIMDNNGVITEQTRSDLGKIREHGTALAAKDSVNRQYIARLEALRGLEAQISANFRRARKHLKSAMDSWKFDETATLLEAMLIDDAERRLTFLNEHIAESRKHWRLTAEKGAAQFSLNQYSEAVSAWDAALPFLLPAWSVLYADQQEQAWTLKDSADELDERSLSLLTDEPVIIASMVNITLRESELLDGIDEGRSLKGNHLYTYLRNNGYLFSSEQTLARRRDAAHFLWLLLSDRLGKPEMRNRFSSRFEEKGSPIVDVEVGQPWFDGVLGTVQYEIMSLTDGRHFNPNGTVSGLDYFVWLKATEAY